MDALSDSISVQDVEELNRQKQQAEMIRQYLQVTSLDTADASPAASKAQWCKRESSSAVFAFA